MDRSDFERWAAQVRFSVTADPARKAAPMPSDPESLPASRGVTLLTAEREDCDWPCVKQHRLRLTWDKKEDRLVAKIVSGPVLRTEEP